MSAKTLDKNTDTLSLIGQTIDHMTMRDKKGKVHPLEIELRNSDGEPVKVRLHIGYQTMWIGIDGHGDRCSNDGDGCQVAIDTMYSGVDPEKHIYDDAAVHIWSDINQEDPTHRIGLNGAKPEARTK